MNTTQDLITHILANNDEKDSAFKDLMADKVSSALEAKKAAIATKIYSGKNK